MTDSTDKPITMNSKSNITFHLNTEGIEVTDKQVNLKLNEELMSIEEPEKLQLDDKMTFEVEKVTEPIKLEDTAMAVDESAQQGTSDEPAYEKSVKAENLMESKNYDGIEVTDIQENVKLNEELMSIEEPEKLQFDGKMTFEVEKVTEPIKLEHTAMAVDESAQQGTSDEPAYEKSVKAENLMESKNYDGIEVTDKQENVKLNEELMSIEEPEKLQFDGKMTFEVEQVTEPIKLEDTAMAVDESAQQGTSDEPTYQKCGKGKNLMESAVLLQESLIQSTSGEILTVGHDSLINGSQQVIPVTQSFPNINVKLEDKRVHLVQHSVGSMKDAEFKDLVNKELSKFLAEEQEQLRHVQPPLLDVKSEYITEDKQTKNLLTLSDDKTDQKDTNKSEYCIDDALSTLANAALNQLPPTNGSENRVILKPIKPVKNVKQQGPAWCDVDVIMGTACKVKQFYPTSITDEHESTSLDKLTDYTNKLKTNLEPGTAYKFCIAAINTCGRGEWSEISVFKTCSPDFPSAPFSIKIKKSANGAKLTWEIPPTSCGKILEYSVCMAIENPNEGTAQNPIPGTTNYYFVRVYSGPHNVALVSNEALDAALIDRTKSPAIIFRIAAKNEKGYGPATQVRWLQDSDNMPGSSTKTLL